MADWDTVVKDYEAQIAKLESDLDSVLTSAGRAVLIFSGAAFVLGVFVGLVV